MLRIEQAHTHLCATIACVALILALCFAACSEARETAKAGAPNVVVIVLDTARPDYLSVYGYPKPTSPYLEEFAKTGTRYDRAYSVSSWTLPAHASLFSGTLPSAHGATQNHPKTRDGVPMLAERLSRAGYQTVGFSRNTWVSAHTGLARGFEEFHDDSKTRSAPIFSMSEHPTVLGLQKWFDEERDTERPYFVFVNLIEPHMPYTPNWRAAAPFVATQALFEAALKAFFPDGNLAGIMNRHYSRKSPLSEDEWSAMRGLYEGDLAITDEITRELVKLVDSRSDPAHTLVFILSDHGENLGDHGHLTHIFNVYDSNLRIVCLARGAGFAPGGVVKELVQIVDVYPTVLRAAGLEPEKDCAGLDLLGELSPSRLCAASLDYPVISLKAFSEKLRERGVLDVYKRELEAVVGERFKLIRGSDETLELYDIVADPGETRPLALDAQAIDGMTDRVLASLKSYLDVQRRAAERAGQERADLPTDPATLEALRSLGYVE